MKKHTFLAIKFFNHFIFYKDFEETTKLLSISYFLIRNSKLNFINFVTSAIEIKGAEVQLGKLEKSSTITVFRLLGKIARFLFLLVLFI